jgi:hypothetical protein
MAEYILSSKILSSLRRLRKYYEKRGENFFRDLIDSCHAYLVEGTDYDNWNGGMYGHDLIMFVPEELMDTIDLDVQEDIFRRLKEDLNKTTPEVESEYIRAVFIREIDEADPQFQASFSFSNEPKARPESVGLWKNKALRLFISHRDNHKATARSLAESLEPYGVSAFVAHESIKPMREWQKEIMNGLLTMEVMLVLLTDDFHESVWTNQEVGFALGNRIPIICVKVGQSDPKGFIAPHQALKTSYENIHEAAPLIHRTLIKEIGQEGRLKEILIEAFISSTSYIDAIENLKRLTETAEKLNQTEFNQIVTGYAQNDQLYGCSGIHTRNNWFKRYLESATGKELTFDGKKILESSNTSLDIPF